MKKSLFSTSTTSILRKPLFLVLFFLAQVALGQTNPSAFDLSSGNWTLAGWSASIGSGNYPGNGSTGLNTTAGVVNGISNANMAFWRHGTSDPTISVAPSANFTGDYTNANGKIFGNNANGIGFSNTGTQGQGSAVLAIKTTGRANIQVAWTARQLTGSSAREYTLRLLYRIGTTGSFVDASSTASDIAYVSGSSTGSRVMPTITLPSDANDKPVVQIMWFYYFSGTGTGTRPNMGIDDINVSSSPLANPTVTLANNENGQTTAANVIQGTTSRVLSSFKTTVTNAATVLNEVYFSTKGTYTSSDITNFKLWRTTGNTFSGATQVGSTITNILGAGSGETLVFSSLNQTLALGSSSYFWITTDVAAAATEGHTVGVEAINDQDAYFDFSGNEILTGSASSSGLQTIVANTTPSAALTTIPTSLTEANLNGAVLTVNLTNASFVGALISDFILNNAPAGVQISSISNSGNTCKINITYDNTDFDTNISNFSVTVKGAALTTGSDLTTNAVTITAVTETISATALTAFGNVCTNAATKPVNSFTLSGTVKVGDISLAALNGYVYSETSTGPFTSTLSFANNSTTLNKTIYVQFSPTLAQAYNGNVVVSGGAAPSINVSASGTGVAPSSAIIATNAATNVVNTTATLNGNFSQNSTCLPTITEKGFVYSVTSTNSNPLVSGTGVTKTAVSGTATGTYTLGLTSLTPNTSYSYKAYVYDGTTYYYGGVETFTTLSVATKLVYGTPPPATGSTNTSLTSFTVQAQRADNSVDTEYVASVTVSKGSGPGAISGTLSRNATAGVATFNDIKFDAAGTYTITASSGSLTPVTSGNIVISAVTSTTDYFRSNNANGTWATANHWQSCSTDSTNDADWITSTLAPTNSASGIAIRSGHVITTSATATANNLTVKDGGSLILNSLLTNSGLFTIEDNGTVTISYSSSDLSANIWAGQEDFKPNSKVIMTVKNSSADLFSFNSGVPTITSRTYNGYTALFGNLTFEPVSGFSAFMPTGGNYNITHNDLTLTYSVASNLSLFSGSSITMGVGRDFITDINTTNSVAYQTGIGNSILNIQRDYIKRGTGEFRFVSATASVANSHTITLNVNRNFEIQKGIARMIVSNSGGTNFQINLNGNLNILEGQLVNGNTTTFNNGITGLFFSGISEQTIDYSSLNSPTYISFNIKNSSLVKLINQNLTLGSNSKFNVLSGGTLDFGFAADGKTALNVLANGSGQTFTAASGSTLKITSPDGITTTANLGNVQVPVAGRTYNSDATFHYIGKANQNTGNGLPGGTATAGTNIKVIADLDDSNPLLPYDDRLTLTINGMVNLNDAGELEIRRGTVLDNPNNGFTDASGQNAKLTMSNGRYKIYRTSGTTQPALGGAYTLNGGVIEFAGNGKFNIRTNKDYLNVEVTGIDVTAGTTDTAGIRFLPNGTFKVMNGGVFKVNNPEGFSGSSSTAIKAINSPAITLEDGSTVEYSRAGDQVITAQTNVGQGTDGNYSNLKVSGSGVKAPVNNLTVNQVTTVDAGTLKIFETTDNVMPNVFTSKKGVQVATGGTVLFENNAQLMQDVYLADGITPVVNSGNITMLRKASVPKDQYNFWAAPVSGMPIGDMYNGFQKVMKYNTETNNYTTIANSTLFDKGIGYSVKGSSNNDVHTVTNGNFAVTTTFVGTPNNGDVMPVELSTKGARYNLLGNPYPSNINLDVLYADNASVQDLGTALGTTAIQPTMYFWDNLNNLELIQLGNNYNGQNYAVYNALSKTGTAATNGSNMKKPNGLVKPGQGFMVRAKSNNGANSTLIFKQSGTSGLRVTANVKGGTDAPYYKGGDSIIDHVDRFWVRLTTPNNIYNTIAVVYKEKAQNTYDLFDSMLMNGAASDLFYSLSNDGVKLAIQGRKGIVSTEDVVPLGFKNLTSGLHTISIVEKQGVFESGQTVYLKDKALDKIVDITNNSYTYNANLGSDDSRFEIVYKEDVVLGVGNGLKSDFVVYRDGSDFVVKSSKTLGKVEVYDTAGRLVFAQTTSNKILKLNTSTLPEGVFIIKAENSGDIKTKKILK